MIASTDYINDNMIPRHSDECQSPCFFRTSPEKSGLKQDELRWVSCGLIVVAHGSFADSSKDRLNAVGKGIVVEELGSGLLFW